MATFLVEAVKAVVTIEVMKEFEAETQEQAEKMAQEWFNDQPLEDFIKENANCVSYEELEVFFKENN